MGPSENEKYKNQPVLSPKIITADNKIVDIYDPEGNTKSLAQDSTNDDIGIFMAEHLADLTVIAPAPAIDDEVINIQTDGVVPVVGNFACLKSGVRFMQVEIIAVTPIAGNDYTVGLAMPIDFAFPIGAGCEVQNINMNVDGSVTPRHFRIGPGHLDVGEIWHISRIIPTMILASAGDDGLFGNLVELAKGVFYRVADGAENTKNLFNIKNNGDFADQGFDVAYPIRSGGGGSHGMRARITFNGPDKRGVVKELISREVDSDAIGATVRDNLLAVVRYRTSVQGHVADE